VLAVHAQAQLPALKVLLALSIPAVLPWRGRGPWAALALGVLTTVLQAQGRLAERWPEALSGEQREVRGRILTLPELAEAAPDDQDLRTWRFMFSPENAPELPSRIRTSWYRSPVQLSAGQCWVLGLRLRAPHGSLNPGGFDYEAWLWRQGIGATATVRSGTPCPSPVPSALPLQRARQALVQRIDGWLPEHPGLPVVLALGVGDDSRLGDRDWEAFRRTGTTHLVAISGFNIAIFAGTAYLLARFLWGLCPPLARRIPAQKAGWLAAAVLGLLYALLAGWDAPVARAAWMLLAVSAAAIADRLGAPSRVLALVWWLLLLLDPSAVMSPGFWLSFAAVASIFLVSQTGLGERPVFWKQALVVQVMLTAALAPLSLFFFSGVSVLGLPINLLAVPIAAVVTPLLVLALGLAALLPTIGVPLLGLVASALDQLREGLVWLSVSDAALWWGSAARPAALILATLGMVLLALPRGVPLRVLGLACLLPLLWPGNQAQRNLSVTVLDVGQGLAVVVRTAHHTLLYDAGPAFDDGFDAGASVVVPYLRQAGIRQLDLLMLSHEDRDHSGGVPAVRRDYPVLRELGTSADNACVAGQRWVWDAVQFEVLSPEAGAGGSDNARSCVLRIDADWSVLLPGDIEAATEQQLLRKGAHLDVDLLVAPHHGSAGASSSAWVQATSGRAVVFAAGWKNRFRHPRPEVLGRYRSCGAVLFNTAALGAVEVDRAGSVLSVRAWRPGHRHFWNAEGPDEAPERMSVPLAAAACRLP
jgi:competence protein ComEC